jgi:tetratricopeptide (TPR) repeat protein
VIKGNRRNPNRKRNNVEGAPAEGSITEGGRALELFTDRFWACRRFCSYLNDDSPPSSVLVFHGDGGNGKSLLLAYLRNRLCKRIEFPNWSRLQELEDGALVARIENATDAKAVPFGRLDFAHDPRDGFGALLKLRRDLAGTGLRFPLFDFAVVTYLHRSKQLTRERIRSLFPIDELDLVLEMADLVEQVPFAGLVLAFLKLADSRLGEWFHRYRLRRNLGSTQVAAILRLDHETELVRDLPRLFAEDLNASLGEPGAPKRVALFFDTHEALWGYERQLEGALYFERDEWLRRLLAALDRPAGTVVILAGREVPRWQDATRFAIADLEPHLVGELTDADALTYLGRAGVADPTLRERLLEDARVGPGGVHPFYLGLGADLALAAAQKGATLSAEDLELGLEASNRRKRIVDRLLRYVEREVRHAVIAVTACRTFDRGIYRYLGQELEFGTSRAGFETLTGFSFVRRSGDAAEERFRVHDLLRRLQSEQRDELGLEAHAAMERYFRRRVEIGDEIAHVDAIYHANRFDWERGMSEWATTFEDAKRRGRFDICRALLEIENELEIGDAAWRRRADLLQADFLFQIYRLDEAREKYLHVLSSYAESASCDATDWNELVEKGLATSRLAGTYARSGQFANAEERYGESLALFDRALGLGQFGADVHRHKGQTFRRLGDLFKRQGRHEEAEACFRGSVVSYDAALAVEPDSAVIADEKGRALKRLGDLQAQSRQLNQALESYQAAVTACSHAIQLDSDLPYVYSGKGNALLRLGDLQAQLDDWETAEHSYRSSLLAYNDALRYAPDYTHGHSHKSEALTRLGALEVRKANYPQAEEFYQDAVQAAEEALRHNPDYAYAYQNKGIALEGLGSLCHAHPCSRTDQRPNDLFAHALEAYEWGSSLAPHDETFQVLIGSLREKAEGVSSD